MKTRPAGHLMLAKSPRVMQPKPAAAAGLARSRGFLVHTLRLRVRRRAA
ncbi:MAG TPA: hypothetical protein VG838_06470 [Opitutaceae bacterium]|nr:hypothetical protein [Lacunisphaera sp.]HWA09095.1 hypothetical protein [Opitutaceae bacterium]